MKTKSILLSLVGIASGICAMAQENDDMYFSSKDRGKVDLKAREEVVMASAKSTETVQTINPSDSYSARNENPDYVAGAKVGANASSTSSYFNPNYQPTVNQSLYSNNCNCGYNNYSYNNYGYGSYGYGNPYYSGYSPYGYGLGMGYGYGMGYGMGMGYGFGYSSMYGMYGSPYMNYGYSYPYMGMGYGFGYPYGYSGYGYGYGYPTTVVVNSNEVGRVLHGRNSVGTSTLSRNSSYYNTPSTGRGNSAYYNGGTHSTSGSRMIASNRSTSSQYYNNAWKQSAAHKSSSWQNNGTSGSRGSFWNNSSSGSRGWSNSSSNWGGGTMRNTGFSGGSPMRSSGFSGGGGFGGGGGGHVGGGGHGRR